MLYYLFIYSFSLISHYDTHIVHYFKRNNLQTNNNPITTTTTTLNLHWLV